MKVGSAEWYDDFFEGMTARLGRDEQGALVLWDYLLESGLSQNALEQAARNPPWTDKSIHMPGREAGIALVMDTVEVVTPVYIDSLAEEAYGILPFEDEVVTDISDADSISDDGYLAFFYDDPRSVRPLDLLADDVGEEELRDTQFWIPTTFGEWWSEAVFVGRVYPEDLELPDASGFMAAMRAA